MVTPPLLSLSLSLSLSLAVRSGYLLNTALESYLTPPLSAGGFGGDLCLLFCEVFASLARLCVTNRVGVEAYQCGLSLLQVGGASSAQRQKGCHIHTHAHTCCIRLGSLQSLVQTVIAGQPTDLLSTRPPILVAAVRHTMSVICASEGEESGPNRAAIQSFKAILLKSCMQWVKHRPTLAVPEQPLHYHLPPSSTDLHTPVLPPPPPPGCAPTSRHISW